MNKHATPCKTKEAEGPERVYKLSDYPLNEEQWQALGQFLQQEEWYNDWPQGFNRITDCQTLYDDINADEDEVLVPLIVSTHGNHDNKRKRMDDYPRLVPRDEEFGPFNDDQHDLYLFIHPDEMGYFAPSAFSSLRHDYFPRDYESIVVDPLLTHSCSYYGLILQEGGAVQATDKLAYCDRFYSEGEDYSLDQIEEWFHIDQGHRWTASVYLPQRNYFQETRDLFSRHFEWLQQQGQQQPVSGGNEKKKDF
jgi:hypothetical protein